VTTARANQLQHALPFIDMYDVLRATAARPAAHASLDLDRDVLSEDDDEDDEAADGARAARPTAPAAVDASTSWVDVSGCWRG
jgi:hypothetical protein